VQKWLAKLSRRRNVRSKLPLNTPCPQILLKGGCIKMHHNSNLQPSLLPSLTSCSPSLRGFRSSGARSRARANVRSERPTTGQGRQNYSPGLLPVNIPHWILYVSITWDRHYNATLWRVRYHLGGVGLCSRKRRDFSSPVFSSCMTWS